MQYRSTRKAVFSVRYHVIWRPKYQILKGRSSRLLRSEFRHLARMKCWWSPSRFVSTVGGAPLEMVRQYVESQKLADARKQKTA